MQRPVEQAPLPANWTAHQAPTGHTYYYNTETKQSTYTRPAAPPPPPAVAPPPPQAPAYQLPAHNFPSPAVAYNQNNHRPAYHSSGANSIPLHDNSAAPPHQHYQNRNNRPRRREPDDRPKSKHAIPGCNPWVIVKTRLGRRFVHDPRTNESFWKIPEEVVKGVAEFDILESKRAAGEIVEEVPEAEEQRARSTEGNARGTSQVADSEARMQAEKTSEAPNDDEEDVIYEEVEVTDDEYSDTENPPKRLRGYDEEDGDDDAPEPDPQQPVEFGEDDMAWQLAQLGETYHLDPGEYEGDPDAAYEDGAEGMGMTDAECAASFSDLLSDYNVNPYKPWESIIEDGAIVSDDRYTLLPTMAARRRVFADWSATRMQALQAAKALLVRTDPRIPYLELLAQSASPKLFWPEFRRKFKKEPALKETRLSEKEKEKLYREHIGRVTKMSEGMLKKDLEDLLRSVTPSRTWNCGTSVEVLPAQVLADIRFISLKPAIRDAVVESVIRRLPRPEDVTDGGEEDAETAQARKERAKRDEALQERRRVVEEDKRRQQKELQYGRSRLRAGEEELDRAMRVGKDGLREALGE